MENKYHLFLEDIGNTIKNYALEAKKIKDSSNDSEEIKFQTGYLCGFHRIITLMQQQAEIYDISLKEINLDINENDLI